VSRGARVVSGGAHVVSTRSRGLSIDANAGAGRRIEQRASSIAVSSRPFVTSASCLALSAWSLVVRTSCVAVSTSWVALSASCVAASTRCAALSTSWVGVSTRCVAVRAWPRSVCASWVVVRPRSFVTSTSSLGGARDRLEWPVARSAARVLPLGRGSQARTAINRATMISSRIARWGTRRRHEGVG
jgi:hypothetical protein